jgi:hypothetical protein
MGSRNFDPKNLRRLTDDEVVDQWDRDMVQPGRLEGNSNPERRLAEMEREGVVGEVLFPDFGLQFEPNPPLLALRWGIPALARRSFASPVRRPMGE